MKLTERRGRKNERDRATATNTNMDKTVNDDLSGRKDVFCVLAHKRALCALCLIHHPGLSKSGEIKNGAIHSKCSSLIH